jgi:hypothetical protein
MKWPIGTELWLVQIRYWEETDNPIRVTVSELLTLTDQRHLKVQHSEYEQEVYVPEEHCFFSRENAIRAAHLLTQLMDLKLDDEVDFSIKQQIERESFINPESRQFTDGAFQLAPVSKIVNVYNGFMLAPSHRPHIYTQSSESTVFWDSYSVDKAAKKLEEEHSPVKISRLSVKVTELEGNDESSAIAKP